MPAGWARRKYILFCSSFLQIVPKLNRSAARWTKKELMAAQMSRSTGNWTKVGATTLLSYRIVGKSHHLLCSWCLSIAWSRKCRSYGPSSTQTQSSSPSSPIQCSTHDCRWRWRLRAWPKCRASATAAISACSVSRYACCGRKHSSRSPVLTAWLGCLLCLWFVLDRGVSRRIYKFTLLFDLS